jgi:hypothetical protein
LQKLFILGALLCSALSAEAQPQGAAPATAATHPLTGSWSWTVAGRQCAETWRYRADGTSAADSGDAAVQSRYEIAQIPSLLGFYRIAETVTEANGKRDCSGDLQEVSGEPVIRFLQFSPKRNQLVVCKEESLKACFGPLKRLQQ